MANWDKTLFNKYYDIGGEPWGRPNTRPEVRLHYHDYSIGKRQGFYYAPLLANLIGLNAGDAIVLVGCGFNWTAEGLVALGAEVIGLDISNYIQGQKGQTEEAELRECIVAAGLNPDTYVIPTRGETTQRGVHGMNLLDLYMRGGRSNPQVRGWGTIMAEDMGNAGSRNRVKNAITNNIRFVITEEMLNSISDAECLTALQRGTQFITDKAPGAQFLHMLSPIQHYEAGHPLEGQQNLLQVQGAADGLNWKSYAEWRTFLNTNGFSSHGIIPTVTYGGVTAYGSIL